jgi:putative hydrolase of the HAD superfamily
VNTKAIWTDFGGVLTPPVAQTLADVALRVGVLPGQLRAAMEAVGRALGTDMMGPLDTPLLTEPEWASRVERALDEMFGAHADLTDFGKLWFDGRPANLEWVEFLLELRQRTPAVFVGMLSNMVPSWEQYWRKMVPADALFDEIVCAYRYKTRKPQREVFTVAERVCKMPPEECLLVDDLESNCVGAESAGWRAIRFRDAAQAKNDLLKLLS